LAAENDDRENTCFNHESLDTLQPEQAAESEQVDANKAVPHLASLPSFAG
jgi:hypothetical protein